MAELVDAQVSGTCGRKVGEGRVFFWAPNIIYNLYDIFFSLNGKYKELGIQFSLRAVYDTSLFFSLTRL